MAIEVKKVFSIRHSAYFGDIEYPNGRLQASGFCPKCGCMQFEFKFVERIIIGETYSTQTVVCVDCRYQEETVSLDALLSN